MSVNILGLFFVLCGVFQDNRRKLNFVKIEHSILGAIQVDPVVEMPLPESDDKEDGELTDIEATLVRCQAVGSELRLNPIRICISDSIFDATDPDIEALGAPEMNSEAILFEIRSIHYAISAVF